MGSDMLVALKEASANGTTLFGLNHYAALDQRHAVQSVPAQAHEPGELVPLDDMKVPQARQTCAVLGVQPLGQWGFAHGVNEHRVAIGVTDWRSRLPAESSPLSGAALVRLTLERSHGAHQAVEMLTDLLDHFGQSRDHIFLIADGREAFVMETCGRFWALLECGHTRVVTDAAMIRQDWRRLAPGLASHVIESKWWQDDGSKLDFVRCLAETSETSKNAQKRWGHASLALAQQQGAIDLHFLRHMLAEHYGENRDFLPPARTLTLAANFLVDLHQGGQPLLAWIAFGSPKVALYFPLCLAGDLPTAFCAAESPSIERCMVELQALPPSKARGKLAVALERLQTKFDQDADDFLAKAHDYEHHGKPYLVGQLATEMMHDHVELFAKEYRRLLGIEERGPHRIPETEEVLFFA